MLNIISMVIKENICRIYRKGNLKEKSVHYKKIKVMEEMRDKKSYKTYKKPISKWQR